MATKNFFSLSTKDTADNTPADVVLVGKDKKKLGEAYKKTAPSGRTYLVCKLDDHWIITNEEYKQLKLYGKQQKRN